MVYEMFPVFHETTPRSRAVVARLPHKQEDVSNGSNPTSATKIKKNN